MTDGEAPRGEPSEAPGEPSEDAAPSSLALPTRDERVRKAEPAVRSTDETPLDLAGRYIERTEIARGGMGRVIEATDTILGRTVALKAALADDRDAMRRFARETRVTARLEHPSIVPVYDAGHTSRGVPFYVMRKVAGRALDQVLSTCHTIDARLALVPNTLAAIEAVAHAHTRGVVHRDLKPANILVGELGETIVIDWGLAKVIDEPDDDPTEESPSSAGDSLRTRIGTVIGTPGFMAPEQLRGDTVTRASDVYALGATLYHVLAGEPPHRGRSSDEMIELATKGPPRSLAEAAPGVPRDLVAIVERAMAYDETVRYADAAALAAELRRFLTGQLVAAHQYSRRERLVRFARKHRVPVAVSAIAVAIVAVIGYVSVTNIVRERNLATEATETALVEKQAAEAARTRETQRADDLLVARASLLVVSNPTAAVALLHQLPPASESWRKARGVLEDARARGVPWVLPASGATSGLAMTRDGKLAYSAGSDGVIRRHDLDSRTTRILLREKGHTTLELSSDERYLAIGANETELAWLELATGKVDRVTMPGSIEQIVLVGDVTITRIGRELWHVARGTPPKRLALDTEKVFSIMASPEGGRVAVLAQPESYVFEFGRATPEPRIVARRVTRPTSSAWSADGKRLALGHVAGIDELDFSTTPPRVRAIPMLVPAYIATAAYAGDDLYFSTSSHVYRHHPGEGTVQLEIPTASYSIAATTRDAAIFVTQFGTIAVAARGTSFAIRSPVLRMYRSVGNPHATRFLVSTHDWLLLFDTATQLPRAIDDSVANSIFTGFVGARHFLIARMIEDWKLYDVASGTSVTLPNLMVATIADLSPDGSYVLAYPNQSKTLTLVRPNRPHELLADPARGVALSATRIAIATTTEVTSLDLTTNTRTPLWKPADEITGMTSRPPHLVVLTKKQLWRHDSAAGTTDIIDRPPHMTTLDVGRDGTVSLGAHTTVWRWRLGGKLEKLIELAQPVAELDHTPLGLLATDTEKAAWRIEDGTQEAILPTGVDVRGIADSVPLAVALTNERQVAIYDFTARYLWTLGGGTVFAQISTDGRHVVTIDDRRILVYSIDVPADRDAYLRRLEATTNLRSTAADDLLWPKRVD